MKKLSLFVSLLILFFAAKSQEKVPFDTRIVLSGGNLRLPSLTATPLAGGSNINLANLQPHDLKYPDKPTLIIAWASEWCQICMRKIDTLISSGADKEFNIITLNVENYSNAPSGSSTSKTISVDDVNEVMDSRKGWGRLANYQVNFYKYADAFDTESTPFWVLLDKNLKVVNSLVGYTVPIATVRKTISDLAQNRIDVAASRLYFDDFITTRDKASYYIDKTTNGTTTVLKVFYASNNKLSSEISYSTAGGTYAFNGPYKMYYANGKMKSEGYMQNGMSTQSKTWYDNGDLKADQKVPASGSGYYKTYYKDGTLEAHYAYLNGKQEGLTKLYDENGKLAGEYNYKYGKLDGTSKEYEDGRLQTEYVYKNGEQISENKKEDVKKVNSTEIRQTISKLNELFDEEDDEYASVAREDALVVPNSLTISKDSRGNYSYLLAVVKWSDIKNIKLDDNDNVIITGKVDYFSMNSKNAPFFEFDKRKYGLSFSEEEKTLYTSEENAEEILRLIKLMRKGAN